MVEDFRNWMNVQFEAFRKNNASEAEGVHWKFSFCSLPQDSKRLCSTYSAVTCPIVAFRFCSWWEELIHSVVWRTSSQIEWNKIVRLFIATLRSEPCIIVWTLSTIVWSWIRHQPSCWLYWRRIGGIIHQLCALRSNATKWSGVQQFNACEVDSASCWLSTSFPLFAKLRWKQ